MVFWNFSEFTRRYFTMYKGLNEVTYKLTYESLSDNVDIELTSFDETLIKWISYKISNFNNTLL